MGAEPIGDPTVSLVVIEDNRLLRERLCELVRRQPGFAVLAAVPDAAVLARVMPPTSPVVVLLDGGRRDDDRVQVCADVRSRFPAGRVIVMGMTPRCDALIGFVQAGAVGFIRKEATTEECLATIRHVANGACALPRALTAALFAEIARQPPPRPTPVREDGARLTTREREIVDLLGEGLSNKEIAARLHIAIHTVKSHVHNVLEKLALHSRLEVVAYSRTPKGHR